MIPYPQPQWIEKMYAAKVGRDHLGLGSVSSDQILPSLSPSINVLTYHPRYHSFYVFLLDEFWQRERPRTWSAWENFFRPREFIFSVGAHLCTQPEHGKMGKIVGAQKTSALAAQQLDRYNTQTDYIKSRQGGYGLYYRTVMAEMGLIYPGGKGFPYPIDVPSEFGKEVADAFRRAIAHTDYFRTFFGKDATDVPLDVVQNYIKHACLCQLQTDTAPDRPLLLDAFLYRGAKAEARRHTFRMLLDLVEQTQGYAIDQNIYRQLLYFQKAENGATFTPRKANAETFRRWRLYQAREYYAFALNGLWYYLCDWGITNNGDLRPIALSELWTHIHQVLDFDALAHYFDVPSPNLNANSGVQDLLNWLMRLVGANDATAFDAACTLDSPINEYRLHQFAYDDYEENPALTVPAMITMLALVYLRFGQPSLWQMPEWEISKMGEDGRLSVNAFIRTLHDNLATGWLALNDFARWMYRDYVILQHQLVATSKLPDNTFRFQREGDRLRFFNIFNNWQFMDSRFDALSTTIHELGLCGKLEHPEHPLSTDGKKLLNTGDLS